MKNQKNKTMKDFSKYQFRASQSSKLLTGTIGLTDTQKDRIEELLTRKVTKKGLTEKQQETFDELSAKSELTEAETKNFDALEIKKNSFIGVSPSMQIELDELIALKKKPLLEQIPKTMKTELRKIYRSEKYNRNFIFTNQYVKKGIIQEEEGITLYQQFRKIVKGINTYFTKNTERLFNDWLSGEPDLRPMVISGLKVGFDIKCSWSLETFPFEEDELNPAYESQNQSYVDLEDADMWITAFVLVNCTEDQLFMEKLKWYHACEKPNDPDDKYYDEYIEKCKEVEKMMIYDYDRFIERYNPLLEISREEWFENGYDIPLNERVIEKVSYRDKEFIEELKKRISIGRDYLIHLSKNDK